MRSRFRLDGKVQQAALYLRLPDPVAFCVSMGRWTSVAIVDGREDDRIQLRPGWSGRHASHSLRAVRPPSQER
eukprot:9742125-Prorocentrum_lima.AAC.1